MAGKMRTTNRVCMSPQHQKSRRHDRAYRAFESFVDIVSNPVRFEYEDDQGNTIRATGYIVIPMILTIAN